VSPISLRGLKQQAVWYVVIIDCLTVFAAYLLQGVFLVAFCRDVINQFPWIGSRPGSCVAVAIGFEPISKIGRMLCMSLPIGARFVIARKL